MNTGNHDGGVDVLVAGPRLVHELVAEQVVERAKLGGHDAPEALPVGHGRRHVAVDALEVVRVLVREVAVPPAAICLACDDSYPQTAHMCFYSILRICFYQVGTRSSAAGRRARGRRDRAAASGDAG